MSQHPTTAMASSLDLADAWSATDEDVAARFHPVYRQGLARAPRGDIVSRGLPFKLAAPGVARRWLQLDEPRVVDLGGVAATYLVLLHFCDAWRDESGSRPVGVPPGWVHPVGQPLANVTITRDDADDVELTLRRRFEVNEGVIGWGAMPFLSLPYLAEAPVDWEGPHARLSEGRIAGPGDAGPMTVLPASWAGNQTGVQDHVPSPTDDVMLWLHAIDVGSGSRPRHLRSIRFEPIAEPRDGGVVVVGAMTAYSGPSTPLRWLPRRSLRIEGARGMPIDVDLGLVAHRHPVPGPSAGRIAGWGVESVDDSPDEEVELTAADDAVLTIGDARVPLCDVTSTKPLGGGVRVSSLPAADRRLRVTVSDAGGHRTPSRVRFVAPDGRYLPPLGHRTVVNPALHEDSGADVIVNGAAYAYVDGEFDIDVTADGASVEVVRGQDHVPLRRQISPEDLVRGSIDLVLDEPISIGFGRWIAGDTHVHFLAPSTALLQAKAEGVNAVHLLATQWGDDSTGITDFGGDLADADGRHAVWVGSENRQNMLGHVGLVGTSRPVLPMASGGPPEGPIGAPVTLLMADWLRQCREQGGLAIGAHFPLPMAEVAADISMGLLDALEFQDFDLDLESPPIREWYRFLNAGYRLPITGGTDKMSATVPLGQIRTWARLDKDVPLTFEAWAGAVRAGRTFVSSGPLLELRVDGAEPGDTVDADVGATLEIELIASAPQAIISDVELVSDGKVVASQSSELPSRELILHHRLRVSDGGWLAGRSRSPFAIGSAFATAMAAHTSPIYIACAGRPRAPVDLSEQVAVLDGTRAWLDQLAPIRDPADLERFTGFLDEAKRRLEEHER